MKVAVIGAGYAGSQHAEALRRTPHASLAAVVDVEPGQAAALAAAHSVPVVDIMAAVSGDCDVVAVCVPPGDRLPLVLAALDHGKAVVVEKPSALSIAELNKIITAAATVGRPVATMHQHRMAVLPYLGRFDVSDAVATCRTSRRRDPAHYLERQWRTDPVSSGGGVLAHLAVHYLDLACQLLGEPVGVHAVSTADHPELPTVDSRAALTVTFDSGAIMAASATTFAVRQEDQLLVEAAGTRLDVRRGEINLVSGDTTLVRERPAVADLRAAVYTELATALRESRHELPYADIRRSRGVVGILESVRRAGEGTS